MRLEPLYRARFTTPERWSVELRGPHGAEAQNLLFAEGRCEGRVAASLRAANFPRRRADDTLTPDFRGVLETDDGATILFTWQGYGRTSGRRRPAARRSDDARQPRRTLPLAQRRRLRSGRRRGASSRRAWSRRRHRHLRARLGARPRIARSEPYQGAPKPGDRAPGVLPSAQTGPFSAHSGQLIQRGRITLPERDLAPGGQSRRRRPEG